jgi:integrase
VSSVPGISERRDTSGHVHYQVRVRRSGNSQTATFAKLSEALAWRERALEAAEGGETLAPPQRRPAVSPPGRTVTVADASRRLCRGMVEGSVRTRDGRPYKPSVVRKYEEALRCVVLPRIGGVPIASLTSGDIQRLVDSIAAERTPEHARKALTALRVALRLAERYGELVANPCAGVRVPVDGQGEKPPRILTPEEATAIVAAGYAEDARRGGSFAGPLATLAFGSGARLGELLALPWGADGLDLEAAVLHVRRSVDRVRASDGLYPFLPPKTRDSRRDIPLAPDDVALLRRHRLATGRPPDGALVFATAQGDALSPIPAQRALKRGAKARWPCRTSTALPRRPPRLRKPCARGRAIGARCRGLARPLRRGPRLATVRPRVARRGRTGRRGARCLSGRSRRLDCTRGAKKRPPNGPSP